MTSTSRRFRLKSLRGDAPPGRVHKPRPSSAARLPAMAGVGGRAPLGRYRAGGKGYGRAWELTPRAASRPLCPSRLQVSSDGCPRPPRLLASAWWAAGPRGFTRLSTSSRYRGGIWGWVRAGTCWLREVSPCCLARRGSESGFVGSRPRSSQACVVGGLRGAAQTPQSPPGPLCLG